MKPLLSEVGFLVVVPDVGSTIPSFTKRHTQKELDFDEQRGGD